MQNWYAAARSASRLRIAYEIGLTVALAVVDGAGAYFGTTMLPPALAGAIAAVAVLVLVPARLVLPNGAFLGAAACGLLVGNLGGAVQTVLAGAAGYRLRRPGRAALAFVAALGCWLTLALRTANLRDVTGLLLVAAAFGVLIVVPSVVGWALGRRRRLLAAMHWRNRQLHDQQATVARLARARERSRIARDLHDSLGHQLTLISLYSGTLTKSTGQQREETVTLLRATAASAMAELRQILGVLAQEEDAEDAVAVQSLSNLDSLADAAQSTGAPFSLTRSGSSRSLPPLIEHAAYRVIQEGLTNALRHARGAPIDVALRYESDTLVVEVVNGPGAGHALPTSRQGLIGLRERARVAGGVLYHGVTPNGGFRLAALLPYQVSVPPDGADANLDPAGVLPSALPGAGAAGDFEALIRRSDRRSRRTLIGVTAVLLSVFGLCGAACAALAIAPDTNVSPERFNALSVGQGESDVRRGLPDPGYSESAEPGDPPEPANAACVYYPASLRAQLAEDSSQKLIYRFCFRDGVLATKEKLYR